MTLKHALLASACASLLVAPAAYAQTTDAGTSARTGNEIETVVVTAQKRSESLQTVPIAVSAYTSETRQIVGINTIQDLTNFTPGLSYSSSNDRVFIRGVGRQTNPIGGDPGVATCTDGVYYARTASVSVSDFFWTASKFCAGRKARSMAQFDRRRDQLHFQTPNRHIQADARFTWENYGVTNVEGSVSGPITDWLRARLAGAFYKQRGGYFKNVAGGRSEGGAGEQRYVELQLDADFSSHVHGWLKLNTGSSATRPRTQNRVSAYDDALYPTGYIAPGSGFGYNTTGYTALGSATQNPGILDSSKISVNTPARQHLKNNFGATTELTWDLPGVQVKYIGGYQQYDLDQTTEIDQTSMVRYTVPLAPFFNICSFIPGCGPVTINPAQRFIYVENKKFGSSELNISSTNDGPFQWIVGAYYYKENAQQESHFNAPDLVQLRKPANGVANPSGDFVTALSSLKTESWAGFGQVDWKIADTVKLTGGLRYTHDRRFGTEALRVVCYGCGGFTPDQYGTFTPALDVTTASASYTPAPGVVAPATIDPATGFTNRGLSASWSAVTGTAGVEWTPTEDSLAYARYSRGYKSGGFNAGGVSAAPETQPEFVNDYELGYKRSFGQTFQANIAAYYYDYKGLQVPLTVPTPSGANLTQFFNLDSSRSYGIELETIWRPTDQLKFMLNYGYASSKIEKACCFVDGTDPTAVQPGAQPVGPVVGGKQQQSLKGGELPLTPKNKVALNAVYTLVFDPGTLDLSASYIWKDSSYSLVFNRFYNKMPSYDQVDLRAVWTDTDDRYRVILFAKNVFDTKGYDGASGGQYISTNFPPSSVGQTYSYTPPRTFGVQLQYHFR